MLEITEIELGKLKPWQDNPRLNEQAVDAGAQSIRSSVLAADSSASEALTRWAA